MRKRYQPKIQTSSEFELDLAPLLAVMVKLVPVLLVSSAFVQIMNIETELPQAVKEAIERQPAEENKEKVQIALEISEKTGFRIVVWKGKEQTIETVALKDGKLDFESLHLALRKVKTVHPEVFRLEIAPEGNVTHKELVAIMDEARKSRDKDVKFPIFDKKRGQEVLTDFMFPEIVFSNVLEG